MQMLLLLLMLLLLMMMMMMMAVGRCRAHSVTAHHLAGQRVAGQHFVGTASHVTVGILELLLLLLDAIVVVGRPRRRGRCGHRNRRRRTDFTMIAHGHFVNNKMKKEEETANCFFSVVQNSELINELLLLITVFAPRRAT